MPTKIGAFLLSLSLGPTLLGGCAPADPEPTTQTNGPSRPSPPVDESASPSTTPEPTQVVQFLTEDNSDSWAQLDVPGGWKPVTEHNGNFKVTMLAQNGTYLMDGRTDYTGVAKPGGFDATADAQVASRPEWGYEKVRRFSDVQVGSTTFYRYTMERPDLHGASVVYDTLIKKYFFEFEWSWDTVELSATEANTIVETVMKTYQPIPPPSD